MNRRREVIVGLRKHYRVKADKVFECGGRFEILGNHTDHNHGLCIAATCDLSIVGAVKKRNDFIIRLYSKGMTPYEIDVSTLEVNKEEIGDSRGLVRGVLAYLKKEGYKVGGFDAYTTSTITRGAGVSSSAAFEMLIGQIQNELFNDNKIDKLTLAKAGQYSENNYFGKNSGLLDQIGTGFGGINFIDFKNIDNPVVASLGNPLKGVNFVIVNSGGSHASLSHLYSALPIDMWNAAKKLDVNYLRESSLENLLSKEKTLFSENEYNRAIHFYNECERVTNAVSALKNSDSKTFFDLVNASSKSSQNYLKNTQVEDEYVGSPQEAIDRALALLPSGACKINGGGFAGSIICFVPDKYLSNFIKEMTKYYGKQNVFHVHIKEEAVKSI